MIKHKAKTLSIVELLDMFSTEHKAVKWLEQVRWNSKPVCAHCGCDEKINLSRSKKHSYWCRNCHKYFTVRTGTVMHASKMDTRKWVIAIYYVLTARKGISSLQLSKELGITQKSSWFMLQRIREMCKQGRFKLSNTVEVDEVYIGGKEENKHASKKLKAGRGAVGKQAVLGLREREGKVKAMPIAKTDAETLKGAIHEHVMPGSTVYTDDHRGYMGLDGVLYRHGSVKHSAREYVNGMAHTNGIESVWALLKRGYYGTYHHFSVKHLQRYIDEFAFRLNEGNCQVDTDKRMIALCGRMGGKRLSYKKLVSR